MKRILLGLFLLLFASAALAQGCGPTNPNCIVPTRPLGDSTNAAASTAFVQGTVAALPITSAQFDAAFGSTRGSILERGAAAWQIIVPGAIGLPFVSNGPGADPSYQLLSGAGIVTNPVISGSLTANSLIASTLDGGTAVNSQLLLESTSAVGTSDSIVLNTGNHVTRQKIFTDGSFLFGPGVSSLGVDTYGGGSNTGKTAFLIINQDNAALTATEHYAAWIGANSQGTGDQTAAGTSFALGLSAIKTAWPTTTVVGEFVALNVVARGGHNNALLSGDAGGITYNVAASFSNNFITGIEGVSLYEPGGSTTGSIALNNQIGSIRSSGLGDIQNNNSFGFFTQAQNGAAGVAFGASNLKTSPKYGNASTWNYFLKYDNDDGTHAAYSSFFVLPNGNMTIANFGAAGTNQKTIRVGQTNTNELEIINAAGSAEIWALTDTGLMRISAAAAFAASGATAGTVLANRPTAATSSTQNEWLIIIDSGGTVSYVPVWH
jgi:hypothetical protein